MSRTETFWNPFSAKRRSAATSTCALVAASRSASTSGTGLAESDTGPVVKRSFECGSVRDLPRARKRARKRARGACAWSLGLSELRGRLFAPARRLAQPLAKLARVFRAEWVENRHATPGEAVVQVLRQQPVASGAGGAGEDDGVEDLQVVVGREAQRRGEDGVVDGPCGRAALRVDEDVGVERDACHQPRS